MSRVLLTMPFDPRSHGINVKGIWIEYQFSYFEMVRAKDEPPAECESGIDEQSAEEKSEHRRKGLFERHDQHVVGAEEAEVAEHAEPHK